MAKKKTAKKAVKKARSSRKSDRLRVLFVSSECAPYAKAGGLGDVVGALPKALHRMGHDVRIMMPLYGTIDRTKYDIVPDGGACVHMGGGKEEWIGVYKAKLDGRVPVWFIDFSSFFDRSDIYVGPAGEYIDNAYRFALLSKAALQVCKDRKFIPDVMHAHDWPTALSAVYLKTWDRILSPLSKTASVLTIHNIGYQGIYDPSAYPYIGVGDEHLHPDAFEDHGDINLLKAGVFFADAMTTVSPTHAAEILSPSGGLGLAPYVTNRKIDFFGILNGADYDDWNPAKDKYLPQTYGPRNMSGKVTCKRHLQWRMGVDVRDDLPLFGVVSRFAHQKGFGLLQKALPKALATMDFQLVVLGTGDPALESFFRGLAKTYPHRVAADIGFSIELSHLIEAGSDFFLMPSLYEPCGLNQIYSMKYGTLPLVRATGGLEDTVENYDEATGTGTGFKFIKPTVGALHDSIGWAVSTWFDRPGDIKKLRKQAMAQDFSWDKSAKEYLRVYDHAMRNRRR